MDYQVSSGDYHLLITWTVTTMFTAVFFFHSLFCGLHYANVGVMVTMMKQTFKDRKWENKYKVHRDVIREEDTDVGGNADLLGSDRTSSSASSL